MDAPVPSTCLNFANFHAVHDLLTWVFHNRIPITLNTHESDGSFFTVFENRSRFLLSGQGDSSTYWTRRCVNACAYKVKLHWIAWPIADQSVEIQMISIRWAFVGIHFYSCLKSDLNFRFERNAHTNCLVIEHIENNPNRIWAQLLFYRPRIAISIVLFWIVHHSLAASLHCWVLCRSSNCLSFHLFEWIHCDDCRLQAGREGERGLTKKKRDRFGSTLDCTQNLTVDIFYFIFVSTQCSFALFRRQYTSTDIHGGFLYESAPPWLCVCVCMCVWISVCSFSESILNAFIYTKTTKNYLYTTQKMARSINTLRNLDRTEEHPSEREQQIKTTVHLIRSSH